MISWFTLPAFFSIVPKQIKWPFLTKRVIHELSEEVMNFNHFTTFDFTSMKFSLWRMSAPRYELDQGLNQRGFLKIIIITIIIII